MARRRNYSKLDGVDHRYARTPRWMLPLPRERRDEQPFVWDRSSKLVCPWPRNRGSLSDERRLDVVCERVAALADEPLAGLLGLARSGP
jgi:hypothetical protein